MRIRRLAGAVITLGPAILSLSACEKPRSAVEQAAEDARAVAMVEAAQNVKAPGTPIDLQPITAADSEHNQFYGAGCTLAPGSMPGGEPLVMANDRRALVKIGGKFVTFAADPGSQAITLGVRRHYVGKAQSLGLARTAGGGTALGQEGMSWGGRVEIRDAQERVIWSSAGVLSCGG